MGGDRKRICCTLGSSGPWGDEPFTSRSSFGDLNARLYESSDGTPRFAEEYSVFNATPGNLRGGPFADLNISDLKRPLSAEGIAAEIAANAIHFSPNLPPVDLSTRLPSDPGLVTSASDLQAHTAFVQPHFGGTPQQPAISTFVDTSSDKLPYLISPLAFADPGVAPEQNWTNLPALDTSSLEQPIDDPFGIVDGSFFNPSLLFTRPLYPSIQTASFNPVQAQSSSDPPDPLGSTADKDKQPVLPNLPAQQELCQSVSVQELSPSKRADQALASSPIKSTRPGLSGGFSENRGKKASSRAALPSLPSSRKHSMQATANGGLPSGRPQPSSQPNGMLSPLKSQQHHRLSSLSSIPESNARPSTRTQAKFTIDANGRARVETVVETAPQPQLIRERRDLSENDDDSSSDDDPIIIPSGNVSFALPDPIKPTRPHPFQNPKHSMSEQSTTSSATFTGLSEDDESGAETVTNEATPYGKAGDAASELRKLRESRHRQASASKSRRFTAGLGLNVTYGRTLPSVYICHFCARRRTCVADGCETMVVLLEAP